MMPGQSSVGRPGAPARGGARPGGARGGNGGGGRGNGGGGARPGGGFGGPRGGRGGNGSTQGAFGRGGGNAPRRRKSKRVVTPRVVVSPSALSARNSNSRAHPLLAA